MIKAYYVLRKDLNMSVAKLAVQVGHGTQLLMLSEPKELLDKWKDLESDSRKIVCGISSYEKLRNLYYDLNQYIKVQVIQDSGYTEFNGKEFTGIAFFVDEQNAPAEVLKKVKRLQLYK